MIKVVFFGTEDFSAPTLEALINQKTYRVIAVVTKPDSVRGRGHKVDSPLVAKIANSHNIKLFQPQKLHEIEPDLAKLKADVGALVSYGKIIPESTIELFPHGIVNFHPSLLPVYRGPSPIETTIANGDNLTGLTLMSLQKEMDAGPIYYQEKVSLNGSETATELRNQFSKRGAKLMIDKLPQIIAGDIKGIDQDNNLAIYCHLINKDDGNLSPEDMTARECDCRIRAYQIWPKCRINLSGKTVIVTKAKVLSDYAGDNWPDIIKCRDDTALQLIEIVSPTSGKKMKVSDFLNGLH